MITPSKENPVGATLAVARRICDTCRLTNAGNRKGCPYRVKKQQRRFFT